MKRLEMENGEVRDADVQVCHECQTPGADYRGTDGEWYHADCAPEGV